MIDYSEMTYERILARCLDRVAGDVDKREGSLIYSAIAPAAAELAALYANLSAELDRAFPDTAEGDDLTGLAKARGIFRLPATKAVRRGEFQGENGPLDIPLGSRFSGGDCNFAAVKKLSPGVYQVMAEEEGEAGNAYFGNLLPIDFIPGLTGASIGEVLIPGEDEESDEALRQRYEDNLHSVAFGGNSADYREKAETLPGVGAVKVFPAWNGGGTVKLVVLSSDGDVPSETLVNEVQIAMDPVQNAGEGLGLAPIGHMVTVAPCIGTAVNLRFTLSLSGGTTWDGIEQQVRAAVQGYFDSLIANWADSGGLVVRISQVESRILDVPGVLDIVGTTLNGEAQNLTLAETAIPVLGTVINDAA